MECIPKVLGLDQELGNYMITGDESENDPSRSTGRIASRLLLANTEGVMSTHEASNVYSYSPYSYSPAYGYGSNWESSTSGYREPMDPTDFARKWQKNGGCTYIDSNHLEICNPETTNAYDFVAAYYAQLMNVRNAQRLANENLPDGQSVNVMVANSDGMSNSYGCHLNFAISRRTFTNIFERRMHYLLWLASYQVSSCIVNGLGKVGSECGKPNCDFQLSQRSDFFSEMTSINTMVRRPIINSRDESHSVPNNELSRFHHISCDSNLMPTANFLKVGILQILLCILESESNLAHPSVILHTPLDAWTQFSHDPSLHATAQTIDGSVVTAIDLQRRYFDAASKFVQSGGCDDVVPYAADILRTWGETLDMLAARDFDSLLGRVDWVLKKRIIEEAMAAKPGMTWQSPDAKFLDTMYGDIAPAGLFWQFYNGGMVEKLIDEIHINHFIASPPEDTRAYTRGHVMRGAASGVYEISHANWDSIGVRVRSSELRESAFGRGFYRPSRIVHVYTDTPTSATAQVNGHLASEEITLDDIENIQAEIRPIAATPKEKVKWNKLKTDQSKQLLKVQK